MEHVLCTILHLSDLHFGALGVEPPELSAELLLRDLMGPDSPAKAVDACVVSGDLAANGREYDLVEVFLARLCDALLQGDRKRILLVPGNHDIDWVISRKCYDKEKFSENSLRAAIDPSNTVKAERIRQRTELRRRNSQLYPSRMNPFFESYARFHGGGMSFPREQPFAFATASARNVLLVGFNSCEFVDHLNEVPTVNALAIMNSLKNLDRQSDTADSIRIAVWHHGTYTAGAGADYLDPKHIELLVMNGFSALLHGHLHRSQYETTESQLGPMIPVVGAGTVGAPAGGRPSALTRQYNIVLVHEGVLEVHSRRREDENSPWLADYQWGHGKAFRTFPMPARPGRHARYPDLPSPHRGPKPGKAESEPGGCFLAAAKGDSHQDRLPDLRQAGMRLLASQGRTGIEDPRFVFGRRFLLRHVYTQVMHHRANRCIDGPQWVGKTAFLQALCDAQVRARIAESVPELSGGNKSAFWIYVDVGACKRSPQVAAAVERRILEGLHMQGVGIGCDDLREVHGGRSGHIVAVLDHFDSLLDREGVEDAYFGRWRSLSGFGLNIVYSMTLETRVPRAGKRSAHYFQSTADTLDFFPEEATAESLVKYPLELAGVPISDVITRKLLLLGGRHPFFLSLARWAYFDSLQRMGEAPENDVLEATVRKFDLETQNLYDGLLARLRDADHRCLQTVMEQRSRYGGTIPVSVRPFVSETGIPFSEHFRKYYLDFYLARWRQVAGPMAQNGSAGLLTTPRRADT
jgi:predicted phosphodiesterase